MQFSAGLITTWKTFFGVFTACPTHTHLHHHTHTQKRVVQPKIELLVFF